MLPAQLLRRQMEKLLIEKNIVGAQVKICEAFDFPIPDNCAPVYVSKAKQATRRRGRPAKPKVENQTF